jgi:Raf kinase inhibitor-like YbhB/YbcL family protein
LSGVFPNPYDILPPVPALALTSHDIVDGGTLPLAQAFDGMGVGGGNRSPHLSWTDPPEGTLGFAVTCFDPDAPTGSGFWHWVLVDVPASVRELETGAGSDPEGGSLPAGAFHIRNDYGPRAYGGAAPPPGDGPHRYIFAVHAVDVAPLGVDADVSPAIVGFNLRFHTVARGTLIATFARA